MYNFVLSLNLFKQFIHSPFYKLIFPEIYEEVFLLYPIVIELSNFCQSTRKYLATKRLGCSG